MNTMFFDRKACAKINKNRGRNQKTVVVLSHCCEKYGIDGLAGLKIKSKSGFDLVEHISRERKYNAKEQVHEMILKDNVKGWIIKNCPELIVKSIGLAPGSDIDVSIDLGLAPG